MDIELGIQHIARPISFTTDQSKEQVGQIISDAIAGGKPIDLTDDKGRRVIIPAQAFAYAIVGSETRHAVGFGAL